MHRRALIESLERFRARDADEAAARDAIRDFVVGEPRCFERSLEAGHVTGSAWVVDPERCRVLLTHHGKLDRWLQLGGHADGDPDVLAVARREAFEESGLAELRVVEAEIFDLDVHTIPARAGEPAHLHYDVRYLLEADPAAPLTVSSESHDLAWIDLERVGLLGADRSVLRMVAKTPRRPGLR